MSGIRPMRREDLGQVADLYELVVRSGRPRAAPELVEYFRRTLLEYPWADPEIPPLVHVDDSGGIDAFQGSYTRRARFDGRSIRIACAGQLVAHPDARRHGVGALLVAAFLRGPQELTITDGATEPMRQMWTLMGGEMAHLQCVEWCRRLPPRAFPAGLARSARARLRGPGRRTAHALDQARAGWRAVFTPPQSPETTNEPLSPAALVENLPLVAGEVRLSVSYDEPYTAWLLDELARVEVRGELIARLVRDTRGRVLGWYVYYLPNGGAAEVLHVAARQRDVGAVLDDLLHGAWRAGAGLVRGRVEPRLLEPATRRHATIRYAGMALVHSRHEEILGAIATGSSLLTRLDGEWWMGHHVLDFG